MMSVDLARDRALNYAIEAREAHIARMREFARILWRRERGATVSLGEAGRVLSLFMRRRPRRVHVVLAMVEEFCVPLRRRGQHRRCGGNGFGEYKFEGLAWQPGADAVIERAAAALDNRVAIGIRHGARLTGVEARVWERYMRRGGRPKEIADEMGLPKDQIDAIIRANRTRAGLDEKGI